MLRSICSDETLYLACFAKEIWYLFSKVLHIRRKRIWCFNFQIHESDKSSFKILKLIYSYIYPILHFWLKIEYFSLLAFINVSVNNNNNKGETSLLNVRITD